MPCSFENAFHDSKGTQKVECSKTEAGPLRTKADYTKEEWQLIQLRSGKFDIDLICQNHHLQILAFYTTKERKCCDPYGSHGTASKTVNLREVSLEFYKQCRHLSEKIGRIVVPGT
jgi:hypothetical protein